jgi:hypothetical protein
MEFTTFKETNTYLGAGDNPNTKGIGACVCRDQYTGRDFIIGKVKVSSEELEKIKDTGEIWIGVMGRGWPPMMVTADNPFTDFKEGEKYIPYEIE